MRDSDMHAFTLRAFILLAVATIAVVLWRAPIVQAISEPEKNFLILYFTEDELRIVSATRSLQSVARIAENIEVVTADDIELINAHSLADVLNTISGVLVKFTGRFGDRAEPDIQDATSSRVTVLIDGIPQNNLGEGRAEVGYFPVQQIARIEVVKGPASSAWGSALGGVVNVITKDPANKPLQATAYLDYGAKRSADYRAELSGRSGEFGYYLTGTGLRTDGLTEGFDVDAGSFNARLTYGLGRRTNLSFSLFRDDSTKGDGISAPDDLSFSLWTRRLHANLAVTTTAGRDGRFDLALWTTSYDARYWMRQISDGAELFTTASEERRSGASARYEWWSAGTHDLIAGADWSTGRLRSDDMPGEEVKPDQWGVYANDTLALGALSVTPGVRFDQSSAGGDFWSPSLGAVYALSRDALLRLTVARGFRDPSPVWTTVTNEVMQYKANPDLEMEKVWSYQAGVEGNLLDLCRVKLNVFRHDLTDAIESVSLNDSPDWWSYANTGRERRDGLELAVQSRAFWHLTVGGNAQFIHTTNPDTGEDVAGALKRVLEVNLKYDDQRSFRALLAGRTMHRGENPEAGADQVNREGFIFDVSFLKKFALSSASSFEAFLKVNNIFDGAQYVTDIYKNPGRWVEGGVRVNF